VSATNSVGAGPRSDEVSCTPAASAVRRSDLAVFAADISISPPAPYEGETITITALIHNLGLENASNVKVRFFVDTVKLSPDIIVTSISHGGSVQLQVNWTAVNGMHTIKIQIDPDDVIKESNETNNVATKVIAVSAKPARPAEPRSEISTQMLLLVASAVVIVAVLIYVIMTDVVRLSRKRK
jgi:subtilase family serine protease